jgi:hypothetical protein
MKTITKTLLPSKDVYIQFTEDELLDLGISAGDKFSVKQEGDGFLLKKHVKMEIDLDEFDNETLKKLVAESIEKDISINEIIDSALETYLADELYSDEDNF